MMGVAKCFDTDIADEIFVVFMDAHGYGVVQCVNFRGKEPPRRKPGGRDQRAGSDGSVGVPHFFGDVLRNRKQLRDGIVVNELL